MPSLSSTLPSPRKARPKRWTRRFTTGPPRGRGGRRAGHRGPGRGRPGAGRAGRRAGSTRRSAGGLELVLVRHRGRRGRAGAGGGRGLEVAAAVDLGLQGQDGVAQAGELAGRLRQRRAEEDLDVVDVDEVLEVGEPAAVGQALLRQAAAEGLDVLAEALDELGEVVLVGGQQADDAVAPLEVGVDVRPGTDQEGGQVFGEGAQGREDPLVGRAVLVELGERDLAVRRDGVEVAADRR